VLHVKTTVTRAKGVRIHHRYEIRLDGQLVADGETVVAAINPTGKVVRLPTWLQLDK
ncbi:MAG: acyl-CoA thioesterase, partial [Planctomycetaceae bacterium]|nr:acyl-CoA thioesterase [Planctomycetaceae bacterium]